jgi:hypothetical protein
MLEVDFSKGAWQKVEARRRKSEGSGEKASTTKSEKSRLSKAVFPSSGCATWPRSAGRASIDGSKSRSQWKKTWPCGRPSRRSRWNISERPGRRRSTGRL